MPILQDERSCRPFEPIRAWFGGHAVNALLCLSFWACDGDSATKPADAGGKAECRDDQDCASSAAALAVGRCDPKDVYCAQDKCHAECLEPCRTVRTDVNPCEEGRLCTQAEGQPEGFCSAKPVACRSDADCPLFVPEATGAAGWTCDNSVCRHPGWTYASER